MSHRNARTTFHGRLLMVRRYQAGWAKAHIAKAMGVSRKCVQTWITRYETDGEAGLVDRSSRPHTTPSRTPRSLENQIVAWRRRHRCGPDEISAKLGVCARTVSRVLRRRGMPYLCDCDPMTGAVIRASKSTAVRYERARPGELVHMDVKKLGRIPEGGGWPHTAAEGPCTLARLATTLNDVTAHSADCRPSADCNQRHDPVHLVGGAIVPDQVDILNWGAAVRSNAAEPIAGRVCFFVMTKGHKVIHGCPDGR